MFHPLYVVDLAKSQPLMWTPWNPVVLCPSQVLMLRLTPVSLRKSIRSMAVTPRVLRGREGIKRVKRWKVMFWQRLQDPERSRESFWVSDFKHKYLVQTGRDYQGKVPASAAPGTYQELDDTQASKMLKQPKPMRESRALPVMPLTPRVVHEHRVEKWGEFSRKVSRDRRLLNEVRETEFHQWYSKVQRVRGNWCRERGVRSRGAYSPAVDASEYWS